MARHGKVWSLVAKNAIKSDKAVRSETVLCGGLFFHGFIITSGLDFHPNLIDKSEDKMEKKVRGWDWEEIGD